MLRHQVKTAKPKKEYTPAQRGGVVGLTAGMLASTPASESLHRRPSMSRDMKRALIGSVAGGAMGYGIGSLFGKKESSLHPYQVKTAEEAGKDLASSTASKPESGTNRKSHAAWKNLDDDKKRQLNRLFPGYMAISTLPEDVSAREAATASDAEFRDMARRSLSGRESISNAGKNRGIDSGVLGSGIGAYAGKKIVSSSPKKTKPIMAAGAALGGAAGFGTGYSLGRYFRGKHVGNRAVDVRDKMREASSTITGSEKTSGAGSKVLKALGGAKGITKGVGIGAGLGTLYGGYKAVEGHRKLTDRKPAMKYPGVGGRSRTF